LSLLNREKAEVDLVIIVSDLESWVRTLGSAYWGNRSTTVMHEWEPLRKRNPQAKIVLIDIEANKDSQAPESRADILNVGGWSDNVFEVINKFMEGNLASDHVVSEVESIDL
jgi:60 kDa SS-A/Ro ribonucleoprotein